MRLLNSPEAVQEMHSIVAANLHIEGGHGMRKIVTYRGEQYDVVDTFRSIRNGSTEYLLCGNGKTIVAPKGECRKEGLQ